MMLPVLLSLRALGILKPAVLLVPGSIYTELLLVSMYLLSCSMSGAPLQNGQGYLNNVRYIARCSINTFWAGGE